jgi:hypothetical protein
MPVIVDPSLREDLFKLQNASPGSWLLAASALKESAIVLYPNPQSYFHFPVAKMLMGLSFENLLKGIILAHTPGLVAEDGKLDKSLAQHDLKALANDSKAAFSSEELEELADLTFYVQWAGRYPGPKRLSEMITKSDSSTGFEIREILWTRLHLELKNIGWIQKLGGPKLGPPLP